MLSRRDHGHGTAAAGSVRPLLSERARSSPRVEFQGGAERQRPSETKASQRTSTSTALSFSTTNRLRLLLSSQS